MKAKNRLSGGKSVPGLTQMRIHKRRTRNWIIWPSRDRRQKWGSETKVTSLMNIWHKQKSATEKEFRANKWGKFWHEGKKIQTLVSQNICNLIRPTKKQKEKWHPPESCKTGNNQHAQSEAKRCWKNISRERKILWTKRDRKVTNNFSPPRVKMSRKCNKRAKLPVSIWKKYGETKLCSASTAHQRLQ